MILNTNNSFYNACIIMIICKVCKYKGDPGLILMLTNINHGNDETTFVTSLLKWILKVWEKEKGGKNCPF